MKIHLVVGVLVGLSAAALVQVQVTRSSPPAGEPDSRASLQVQTDPAAPVASRRTQRDDSLLWRSPEQGPLPARSPSPTQGRVSPDERSPLARPDFRPNSPQPDPTLGGARLGSPREPGGVGAPYGQDAYSRIYGPPPSEGWPAESRYDRYEQHRYGPYPSYGYGRP